MSGINTLLNGIRAAIGKVDSKLKSLRKDFDKLAYVPIYETHYEEVFRLDKITDEEMHFYVDDNFPKLTAGTNGKVVIGGVEYPFTMELAGTLGDGSVLTACGDADVSPDIDYKSGNGEPYFMFCLYQGDITMGGLFLDESVIGKSFSIQIAGDTVQVGTEWLPDYVNGKDTALQELIKTAKSTADTAKSTADTAKSTADKAIVYGGNEGYVLNLDQTIEKNSYESAKGLLGIICPHATEIEWAAFRGCTSLTTVDIPSVTSIGDWAFSYCSSLTSIVIPNGVTSIGDYAFYDCSSLTSITFAGTVEQWNAITLGTNWKFGAPAAEVVCSDGTVAL